MLRWKALVLTISLMGWYRPMEAQNVAHPACLPNRRFAIFMVRPLEGKTVEEWLRTRPELGRPANLAMEHEQLFFCENGRVVENLGFTRIVDTASQLPQPVAPGTILVESDAGIAAYFHLDGKYYNFDRMSEAVGLRQCVPMEWRLLGENCQDFSDVLRMRYWLSQIRGNWRYYPGENVRKPLRAVELQVSPAGELSLHFAGSQVVGSGQVPKDFDDDPKPVPVRVLLSAFFDDAPSGVWVSAELSFGGDRLGGGSISLLFPDRPWIGLYPSTWVPPRY